jgi:purine-binding chemotaxis protein CheW
MSEPVAPQAWCLFQVRSRAFGVPLENVAEIVAVDDLARLPLAPPRLLGLCVLRRDVIPVIELDAALPVESKLLDGKSVVLVLQGEHGHWGLRIDGEGTQVVEDDPEDPEATSDDEAVGARRWVRRGERTYTILDPEATWRDTRSELMGRYGSLAAPADAGAVEQG